MSDAFAGEQGRRLRNRARLLEFLKFRVLASQEGFFETWHRPADANPQQNLPAEATGSGPGRARTGPGCLAALDVNAFRSWLEPLWPAAVTLGDDDLRQCLEQAHTLYVDPSYGGRR